MNIFSFTVFCLAIAEAKHCRPRSDAATAASEMGLHCLHKSPKRSKRV